MQSVEHSLLPQDTCLELYEGGTNEDAMLINLATHEYHVLAKPEEGYHWVLDFDTGNGAGILDQLDNAGIDYNEESVWAQDLLQWCAYLRDPLSTLPVSFCSLVFVDQHLTQLMLINK